MISRRHRSHRKRRPAPRHRTRRQAGVEVRAVTRASQAGRLPAGVDGVRLGHRGHAGRRRGLPEFAGARDDLAATVEAARDAGVRRLVALSAINADDDFSRQPSRFRGDRNKEVDELAAESGLEWVSLRPTVFASNFAGMWAAAAPGG